MTNKTREKLREEFEKKFSLGEYGTLVEHDGDYSYVGIDLIPVWNWVMEKVSTQSENRILRKWKKAMEYDNGETFSLTEYLENMNSEYLKAKKEVNK